MDHFKMGKFIATLRKEKGLTQEEVARRLGITSQAVSKWEKGVNVPDISFLKELSEILDVEVEELLKGERRNNGEEANPLEIEEIIEENQKRNSTKNKKLGYVIGVFVSILLISAIGIGYLAIKESKIEDFVSKIPHKSQGSTEFVEIDKNDQGVFKSLNYFNFMLDTNEALVKKLFDGNKEVVRKDDFTMNEKMFLVLNQYHKKSGMIYYCEDCYFKKEELEGLVFEDIRFLEEYAQEGKSFMIQDSIQLKYERGMFVAVGKTGADIGAPSYVFDVLEAKRNDDSLVIDFRVAFSKTDFEQDMLLHLYKKYGDDTETQADVDDICKWNDQYKFYQASLSEQYHTFRYTLKVNGDNLYFESLERVS